MKMCNETVMRVFTQMDSHLYNKVQLCSSSLSYVVNMLLSVPLLLVIARPPALLSKLRFLLLIHLLFCNNLQLFLKTVMAVMFISQSGLLVSQCLVFTAGSQACSMVQVLLSVALAVDRCVAIKWPLRYELLFSPRRKQALVVFSWGVSTLLSMMALCMGLHQMLLDAKLPRCRPLLVGLCLTRSLPLQAFCVSVSALVLPASFLTTLGCFLLLCQDIRGLPCSRRGVVTLALQAIQMLCYSVPVVLTSYLLPNTLQYDTLEIAVSNAYNLGISLVPLVYGYRSRELQKRLLQALPRNTISPGQ
ncbi:5-hydroxytryptamine receptor 6-like [Conger conger]|uniref:5-hydroxytryptamine receptor 6-like n=1 Tax=Conger conger TaxID=82655 RepID=UPI002A5ACD25|nr:5-hydroxytryptamine receptor 6-like [Conger conger]